MVLISGYKVEEKGHLTSFFPKLSLHFIPNLFEHQDLTVNIKIK